MKIRVLTTLAAVAFMTTTAANARDMESDKVMPNGEKIVCKRTEETGSLVRATKRCYTRVQWDRIAEAARLNATRMQSDHTSALSSN